MTTSYSASYPTATTKAGIERKRAPNPAQAYVDAVKATGSTFTAGREASTLALINGLISDGVWDKIRFGALWAAYAGIGGILVDLKLGGNFTNNGFVLGDYSETTGLMGDDVSYIDVGSDVEFTANGMGNIEVPECFLRWNVAGGTPASMIGYVLRAQDVSPQS